MQVFSQKSVKTHISILKNIPISINIKQGQPGTLIFENQNSQRAVCLKCINPRCIFFSDQELECNIIKNFPKDNTKTVCAAGAITWDEELDAPVVNNQRCLNCGICIKRCPVGALYFTPQGNLSVNLEPTDFIEKKIIDNETKALHYHQIDKLLNHTRREENILLVSDKIFEKIYGRINKLDNDFHNLLCRNLLLALGSECSIRRIGDVYTRMDAIYKSSEGSYGAVEIEFGKDTLEASRALLDDIAVLNTRYNVTKQVNKPIVICLQLPNVRQGYWQVVKDIMIVEKIKIGTITVGALMILLWNGCHFKPENDAYYLDYDNMNLRKIICKQIAQDNIPLSEKKLGIIEPAK